jgi:GAF domain-containing protein
MRVGEQGIVGYVTGQGRPRVALDVGRDAVHFDNPDLPETRSEVALPLRARGAIIGALDVQSIEPAAFSDEDVAVLQTLADQITVAISNARLFRQVEESVAAERRAYGELSRQAWQTMLSTRPDLGFVSQRQGTAPIGALWESQMEKVIQTGEIIIGEKDGRALAVPVKARGQVIGVFDAQKPEGAGDWTADEVALMETLAEQLGVALESARLYEDTQRRAAEEQLLGQVTARMRETLDVDTVLQTAIQEMGAALGLSRIEVRMGELQTSVAEGGEHVATD